MAHPPNNTYMAIPPPPLPEFYQQQKIGASLPPGPKHEPDDAPSPALLDRADERYKYYCSAHVSRSKPAPPPMSPAQGEVLGLAVYHICRICQRPRSVRYHREHPIPIDGVPPPPGICRRCRVTSVDEFKTVTQIVEKSESNDLKLGVQALVAEKDYFNNDEMKSKHASYILNRAEPIRKEQKLEKYRPKEREEIIYRHVHVSIPPPPPPPVRPSTAPIPQDVREKADVHIRQTRRIHETRPPSFVPPPPLSDIRKMDTLKASISNHASESMKSKHSFHAFESRCESKAAAEHTESQIRRIARDEVERYRQAERKIEAHKHPYAHGKLVPMERVPVERRIELQKDVAEELPWETGRRDSGVNILEASRGRDEKWFDQEEIVVVRQGRHEHKDPKGQPLKYNQRMIPSPQSSSSDKTRWPSKREERRFPVPISPPPPSNRGKQSQREQQDSGGPPRKGHGSANDRYEVFEITERRDVPSGHDELHNAKTKSERQYEYRSKDHSLQHQTGSGYESNWTDRDYRERGGPIPANKEHTFIVNKSSHILPEGPQKHEAGGSKPDTSEHTRHRQHKHSRTCEQERLSLPYPEDVFNACVAMPSPSSHASQPVKKAIRENEDREYFYMERTVEPLDKAWNPDASDPYYMKTEERLLRRKPAENSPRQEPAPVKRSKAQQRRPSDASSRVRFANKVHVSPTPPGSDASTSEFRDFARRKAHLDDCVPEDEGDGVAEYVIRGRSRSRDTRQEYDYYYERMPREVADRDGTPRPSDRNRRPSGSSETATAASTLLSNVRPIARALSESPSREKLMYAAQRQRSDGIGPYVVQEGRSASVEVEDGSTLSGGSDSRRKPERRHRDGSRKR